LARSAPRDENRASLVCVNAPFATNNLHQLVKIRLVVPVEWLIVP
jgi:hypothetical protein